MNVMFVCLFVFICTVVLSLLFYMTETFEVVIFSTVTSSGLTKSCCDIVALRTLNLNSLEFRLHFEIQSSFIV